MFAVGLWGKVQDKYKKRKAMGLEERKRDAISVVEALLTNSKVKITEDQVRQATRCPQPYDLPCQNTMQEVGSCPADLQLPFCISAWCNNLQPPGLQQAC